MRKESYMFTPSEAQEEAAWADFWRQEARNERFIRENRRQALWARELNECDPDDPYRREG